MKLDPTITGLASSSESIPSGTLAVSSSCNTSVIFHPSIKITVSITWGEQVVVMPIGYEEDGSPKTPAKQQIVSSYAKEGIQRKLQQLLPCDFHLSVRWNEIDLYIPEYYKGKIIGKGWSSISNLEKEIGLWIHVRTFNELPLLDVKVDIAWGERKGEPLIISLPESFRNKTVPLLVDDWLIYAKADNNANIVINNKQTSSIIKRKGFVVVNTEE